MSVHEINDRVDVFGSYLKIAYYIIFILDVCNSAVGLLVYLGFVESIVMEKNGYNPPPYGWSNDQPPPAAPPSYAQAVGGVGPSSPYTPQYPPSKRINKKWQRKPTTNLKYIFFLIRYMILYIRNRWRDILIIIKITNLKG